MGQSWNLQSARGPGRGRAWGDLPGASVRAPIIPPGASFLHSIWSHVSARWAGPSCGCCCQRSSPASCGSSLMWTRECC